MIFTMEEPFYGILLSSMDRVPDKTIPTLGVGKFGNVFKLYYNPDWVGQFNPDTVLQLLKHECLHLALNHFITMEDKEDGTKERHTHCNAAIDLEANCYIDRSKMEKAAGGCFVEDFGFARELGSREYFNLLAKQAQQQQQQKQQAQAKNPQQPCNGGQGGDSQDQQDNQTPQPQDQDGQGQNPQQQDKPSGNQPQQSPAQPKQDPDHSDAVDEMLSQKPQSFDDHSRWPNCETEQEQQMLQQAIDDLVEFAAEETEKRCGQIPGELAGRIEKIRKKPKPVADWRRYFRRYLGNEFSEVIRKSKKRESRRFPEAAGNRHRRKSHILVAIDTSGSVSMPEYREFFGQILTLKDKATFHVVECDAVVRHEYDFNGKIHEDLHGGGGTSFYPPVQIFNENRRKYDALVYFTDGGAPIPENTPKETLWVISSRGDQDRKRYKVNGAKSVFIPAHTNN